MKDTMFRPNNQHQSMINDDGEPKGMKQILIECGLWRDGLSADCKLCKDKIHDILTRTDCCARRIISLQPDFLAQKSALEKILGCGKKVHSRKL